MLDKNSVLLVNISVVEIEDNVEEVLLMIVASVDSVLLKLTLVVAVV